ncbi:quinone-dependent dihydroorotate dehydrogenase [Pseudohoeflea coraliihabitans]|uniref:Dihydroorotate dehydrogenase (quinone) n=1 Tax=Pseudohoeflea coraliihabitans TaxID=2860393 RepID=A0ABS6WNB2_9HYPH|nr:quinone-dependent dihydroorotate dehydrogenase [Pseudohoeflea sp. DP4N28-3]MBW3097449.1 quinone-dependent dihydroorotate dehydrogenase [Pseudohoeflea sp. DP4N28-3]
MSGRLAEWGGTALFALPPEAAHTAAITALAKGLGPRPPAHADHRLRVEIAGLRFANPLGLAAGFDKNAQAAPALFGLGFGAVEIGTVTPRPQPGNPKPRLFRLASHHAIINRLGFNNDGHAVVRERLGTQHHAGVLGINIGANKDSGDRVEDYVQGIGAFHDIADYFTVNISSPNTPGLRQLQDRTALAELLERVLAKRDGQTERRPVFVKIAPDLSESELDAIAAECQDKKIDGVVVSNTTLSRSEIAGARHFGEAGGLSGRPLFARSTIVLAKMRQRLGPKMPLIGAGGVESAETAAEKMRAGADLVQVYTGFIYGGPSLPQSILEGLSQLCDREGLEHIGALRDRQVEAYASRPLPAES